MRHIHVLIIDDDVDDREFFCEAVKEVDPTIVCYWAKNGFEALELLNKEETLLPDYIFLDLNMPRLSGKQCLVKIKSSPMLAPIPVIMYSTSKRQNDIDETIKLGAACFFTKPGEFQQLKKFLSEFFKSGKSSVPTQ